jgi:hypothetical protein
MKRKKLKVYCFNYPSAGPDYYVSNKKKKAFHSFKERKQKKRERVTDGEIKEKLKFIMQKYKR